MHGFLSLARALGIVQGDTIVFINPLALEPVQPHLSAADKSTRRFDHAAVSVRYQCLFGWRDAVRTNTKG